MKGLLVHCGVLILAGLLDNVVDARASRVKHKPSQNVKGRASRRTAIIDSLSMPTGPENLKGPTDIPNDLFLDRKGGKATISEEGEVDGNEDDSEIEDMSIETVVLVHGKSGGKALKCKTSDTSIGQGKAKKRRLRQETKSVIRKRKVQTKPMIVDALHSVQPSIFSSPPIVPEKKILPKPVEKAAIGDDVLRKSSLPNTIAKMSSLFESNSTLPQCTAQEIESIEYNDEEGYFEITTDSDSLDVSATSGDVDDVEAFDVAPTSLPTLYPAVDETPSVAAPSMDTTKMPTVVPVSTSTVSRAPVATPDVDEDAVTSATATDSPVEFQSPTSLPTVASAILPSGTDEFVSPTSVPTGAVGASAVATSSPSSALPVTAELSYSEYLTILCNAIKNGTGPTTYNREIFIIEMSLLVDTSPTDVSQAVESFLQGNTATAFLECDRLIALAESASSSGMGGSSDTTAVANDGATGTASESEATTTDIEATAKSGSAAESSNDSSIDGVDSFSQLGGGIIGLDAMNVIFDASPSSTASINCGLHDEAYLCTDLDVFTQIHHPPGVDTSSFGQKLYDYVVAACNDILQLDGVVNVYNPCSSIKVLGQNGVIIKGPSAPSNTPSSMPSADAGLVAALAANPTSTQGLSTVGTIALASAGLLLVLMLLFLVKSKTNNDSDAARHVHLKEDSIDGDSDTYLHDSDVNTDKGSPPSQLFDPDASPRRKVHVLADEEVSYLDGTAYSSSPDREDMSTLTGYRYGGQSDVHVCQSALCKICEEKSLYQSVGLQFIPTADAPSNESMPTTARRSYEASDTIDL